MMDWESNWEIYKTSEFFFGSVGQMSVKWADLDSYLNANWDQRKRNEDLGGLLDSIFVIDNINRTDPLHLRPV